MTKTASARAPTSAAEDTARPPIASNAVIRGPLGSKPVVSKPAAMRFFARPDPMLPSPTTPAFILAFSPLLPRRHHCDTRRYQISAICEGARTPKDASPARNRRAVSSARAARCIAIASAAIFRRVCPALSLGTCVQPATAELISNSVPYASKTQAEIPSMRAIIEPGGKPADRRQGSLRRSALPPTPAAHSCEFQ